MLYLKQSTAATVKIGPFVDETDGKTAETGLTISQADVRLSKNGGDIAQKTESTTCTHDELGVYDCPLDTTDTATLGRLQLWVHESGALPVWHEFTILSAQVYDSLIADSDELQVHANEITAGLITAAAIATGAIDADAIAADAITAAKVADGTIDAATFAAGAITATVIATGAVDADALATDAVDEIVDQVWNELIAGHAGAGSTGEALAGATAPTAAAVADAVWDELSTGHTDAGKAGEQLWTDLDAVLVDTGTSGVVVASIAAGAVSAAAVGTGAIDADSLATDAVDEIVDQVWNELIAGHAGAGSTGATVSAILDDTDDIGVAGAGLTAVPWNAAWDAEVESEATDALNAYDPPTKAEMDARTLLAADYFDPAADTVVNVTTVGSVTGAVGSVSAGGITAASIATGAIDADALAADAVDEILDEAVEGAYTLRQAIRIIMSALAGKVSGGGTTTVTFRDVNDTADRIVATVTAVGNRTNIVLTAG